jgi:hypothetical protein
MFLTVLEERLALPFGATVLGEAVVVEKIDLSEADGLIAVHRRRRGVPPLVSTARISNRCRTPSASATTIGAMGVLSQLYRGGQPTPR